MAADESVGPLRRITYTRHHDSFLSREAACRGVYSREPDRRNQGSGKVLSAFKTPPESKNNNNYE